MARPPVPPGTIPSPNIWDHPETYELENRSITPAGAIESALRELADWEGRDLLDVGCGAGFHLPLFAATARSVVGVEPHPGLAKVAGRRTSKLANVQVLNGTAQELPLAPASVDIAQARWAYFFGPGCEPGLAELARVVRRGGTAYVVDNDGSRSTFGGWFRRGYPKVEPAKVERFWSAHGWQRRPLDVHWQFNSREDFESVVRIEFDRRTAEEICAEHQGLSVDYALNLWWRHY